MSVNEREQQRSVPDHQQENKQQDGKVEKAAGLESLTFSNGQLQALLQSSASLTDYPAVVLQELAGQIGNSCMESLLRRSGLREPELCSPEAADVRPSDWMPVQSEPTGVADRADDWTAEMYMQANAVQTAEPPLTDGGSDPFSGWSGRPAPFPIGKLQGADSGQMTGVLQMLAGPQ